VDTSKESIAEWCQTYLGIDSALAVSLLIEVEQRYDIELSPETLFEHPTLHAVATYLHEQIQQRVAR
jgi:acyl carrier protein